MKKLFSVETKKYKTYYVIADSYEGALSKVERHIFETIELLNTSIIDVDGSLKSKTEDESITITNIRLVSAEILF